MANAKIHAIPTGANAETKRQKISDFRSNTIDVLEKYCFGSRDPWENNSRKLKRIADMIAQHALPENKTAFHEKVMVEAIAVVEGDVPSHDSIKCMNILGTLSDIYKKEVTKLAKQPLVEVFKTINFYIEVANVINIRYQDTNPRHCNGPNWRLGRKFSWKIIDFTTEFIVANYFRTVFASKNWEDIIVNQDMLTMNNAKPN